MRSDVSTGAGLPFGGEDISEDGSMLSGKTFPHHASVETQRVYNEKNVILHPDSAEISPFSVWKYRHQGRYDSKKHIGVIV